MLALLLLLACQPPAAESCTCPLEGHGAVVDGECLCLPSLSPTATPPPTTLFELADGEPVDWEAVDAALATGPVTVTFRGAWPDRLHVGRTDTGPHRLLLDGRVDGRARVAGIHTGYDDVGRHRVTVRGFDVTGSRDKGVYWRAGDEVVLEDLLVHDNDGSPAITLEYANRTGLPSASFTVRNSHVWDQRGECIYIGGAEGEDLDAHERVVIENNLIHDCWRVGGKHDGINIKDRIGEVVVRRNVVFRTRWGLEIGSPGLLEDNVVFDTWDAGIHLSDAWGPGLSELVVRRAVVLRADRGIRLGADRVPAHDVVLRDVAVWDSGIGLVIAGEAGASVRLDGVDFGGNDVAVQSWGDVDLDVVACGVDGDPGAAPACEPVGLVAPTPAGPDGLFFTGDERPGPSSSGSRSSSRGRSACGPSSRRCSPHR